MNTYLIPDNVKKAIDILESAGYEAYLVGGCVRDMMMGIVPHDYDITTSALPEETKACFSGYRVIETGLKHGTVTVHMEDDIEITTYRVDGQYNDFRRPDSVRFTRSLSDDLARRDFTMNALAYSERRGLVDLFGGKHDIENRIIRCVGEPEKRFFEDALRIMRAIRFSSVLTFKIEEKTSIAVFELKDLLDKISRERIYSELTKLICGVSCESVMQRYREVIYSALPFLSVSQVKYNRCVSELSSTDKDKNLRLSILLSESTTEEAHSVLNSLKPDNATKKEVLSLLELADTDRLTNIYFLKAFLGEHGFPLTEKLVSFQRAKGIISDSDCTKVNELISVVKNSGECISISGLAVNGKDMLALGLSGDRIRFVLSKLLSMVITGECENKKGALICAAKSIVNR